MNIRHLACALSMMCIVAFASAASARSIEIDIYGPGQNALNVGIGDPQARNAEGVFSDAATDMAAQLNGLLQENLYYLPFVKLVSGESILGGNKPYVPEKDGVDLRKYQLAGVDFLISAVWPPPHPEKGAMVELRAHEVFTGKMIVGNRYFLSNGLDYTANEFCYALMKALTGRGEFFRSTLAFTRRAGKNQKDIWAVTPVGRNLRQLTDIEGQAVSPAWSPDGRYVLFSHMGERFHSLGVWDRLTRRTQKIQFPGNTIIGPSFLPDNTVAVSLASGGNPDIFLLNHVFKKEKILVQNWAIDVSPGFDAKAEKMVFVSSRRGNPHIFIKDMETGVEKRITREGKYNTDPTISPDGELVAFARRTDEGHRIFVMDLVTGNEKQVSFGPGNDEQPSFGPDGYFLAFASNRSGKYQIYLTTRHGGEPRLVKTGDGEATHPAWGMIPRKYVE